MNDKLYNNRIKNYFNISSKLACFSNSKLFNILNQSKPMHVGIGGQSVLTLIDDLPVFVKKIPLTDLERRSENRMSTANLFDLPLCYQYGIGSTGFGAWRELAAHIITTNWVISKECPSFPLLFHWRILSDNSPIAINSEQLQNLEQDVQYWENSGSIRKRLESIHNASKHILLFLEYIPNTLHQWIGAQLKNENHVIESAISFVDENLKNATDFMRAHGLIHFDAHFANILTDGNFIYLSDFGLALSSQFELTQIEIEFFNKHQIYDRSSVLINFLYTVITHTFGEKDWIIQLTECLKYEKTWIPYLESLVKCYAPVAFTMNEFYQNIRKETKSTIFPTSHLSNLLAEIDVMRG